MTGPSASNSSDPSRTAESLPPLPPVLAQALPTFTVPEPQDAPPLRWGIIGAGHIAGTFASDVPAYSSGRVVAVGARDRGRAEVFAAAHPQPDGVAAPDGGVPAAVGSYEDLVSRDDVDAVYVATPHAFHAEHALTALEAGKPVLVEKAFTRNRTEAESVLAEARSRHLFAMEAMWSRFLPSQLLTRAVAETGLIGDVVSVRADHFQPIKQVARLASPELAGGALLDLGVYPVSLIHSILGAPRAVDAVGHLTGLGVDMAEAVVMGYPDAVAVASSGMNATSAVTAEVTGTVGRVELATRLYAPTHVGVTLTDTDADRDPKGRPSHRVHEWDGRVPGGFQYQAAEVARCLAAGAIESEVLPWQDTLEVMAVLDRVRAAIGVVYPGER